MTYVSLKLITNDIIIGKVDSECDEYITIEDPVEISYGMDFEGNVGIKYLHYMPFSEQKVFTIAKKYIIVQGDLTKKIEEYYTEFTTSSTDQEKELIPKLDKSKLH